MLLLLLLLSLSSWSSPGPGTVLNLIIGAGIAAAGKRRLGRNLRRQSNRWMMMMGWVGWTNNLTQYPHLCTCLYSHSFEQLAEEKKNGWTGNVASTEGKVTERSWFVIAPMMMMMAQLPLRVLLLLLIEEVNWHTTATADHFFFLIFIFSWCTAMVP